MKSAIGILTYRRLDSLKLMLGQAVEWCKGCPIAVFEDCGQTDDTELFLTENAKFVRRDFEYEADVYEKLLNGVNVEIYLSHTNAGVAGNSNKAMKWFMDQQKDCDHLCLCNDDLIISGPFHETYANAHAKLEVGLFCFTDFAGEAFKTVTVKAKGIPIKLMTRMTGIMMSMTRAAITSIGYYDAYSFTFGQEHCDWTNRARVAGLIQLNGHPQSCLDVVCSFLAHQEVDSSLTDDEKANYNADADYMIEVVGSRRLTSDPYVGFSTGRCSRVAGAQDGVGIPASLLKYGRVKDNQLEGAWPIRPPVRVIALSDSIPKVQDLSLAAGSTP